MLNRVLNQALQIIRLEKTQNPSLRVLKFEILLHQDELDRDILAKELVKTLDSEYQRGWDAAEKNAERGKL